MLAVHAVVQSSLVDKICVLLLAVQVLMRVAQVATAIAAAAATGADPADASKTDVSAAQAAAQAHLTLCEARCLVRAMLRMPSSLEQGKLPTFSFNCVLP